MKRTGPKVITYVRNISCDVKYPTSSGQDWLAVSNI